jgi:hypothetical protein
MTSRKAYARVWGNEGVNEGQKEDGTSARGSTRPARGGKESL